MKHHSRKKVLRVALDEKSNKQAVGTGRAKKAILGRVGSWESQRVARRHSHRCLIIEQLSRQYVPGYKKVFILFLEPKTSL